MSSNLDSLLTERQQILDQIGKKKAEIEGHALDSINETIRNLEIERQNIILGMRDSQNSFKSNYSTMSKSDMDAIAKKLEDMCGRLSDIDKLLLENKNLANAISADLLNKGNDTLQTELDSLLNKLSKNTEDVGNSREQDRLFGLKNKNVKKMKQGKEKIWVDEPSNIFAWYDKQGVINETMMDMFKTQSKVSETTYKNIGYKNGSSDMFTNISSPKIPGLPALLSLFIDLVVKVAGSFCKNFLYFKNGIDMLAGLELGELIGIGVPGVINVLKELKLFLTNPKAWIAKNLFGSLMKSNIPFPAFKFDLGAIIPLLPFIIEIPKVDLLGLLDSLSPFNKNADQSKIPFDWNKPAEDKTDTSLAEKLKRLAEIQARINVLEKEINDIKSKASSPKSELDALKKQYDALKVDIKVLEDYICANRTKMSDSEFDDSVSKLNEMNSQLVELDGRIKNYVQPEAKSDPKLVALEAELAKLKAERDKIKGEIQSVIKQKAVEMSVETGIVTGLIVDRFNAMIDIGIDITDNDNVHYIQKIGYNFKSDDHIDKLKKLKEIISTLSDVKLLQRLYDVGFNINDTKCFDKLNALKKYKIDITDTKLMSMYNELGFNFNHYTAFGTLASMNDDYAVKMGDYDVMLRLNSIGFNFNNPFIMDRFKILSKYVKVGSDAQAFDGAINMNANLNNKYLDDIFSKYYALGLAFDPNAGATEADILANVTPTDVSDTLKVLAVFRYGAGYATDRGPINDATASGYKLGDKDGVTIKDIVKTGKSLMIKYFQDSINKFKKYGIYLKELEDNAIMEGYIIPVEMLNNLPYIESKLNVLLDFVVNKGWVINGTKISSTVGEDELKDIAKANGLELTSDLNTKDNQVNKDVLQGVYGNFDKIGLNITDGDFDNKFKTFISTFSIDMNDSVILNTKRHVYLETDKKKNEKGEWKSVETYKIDLGENKPDPELFEMGSSKFIIENYLDVGKDKPEVKTVAKFDAMNSLGFNYQMSEQGNMIQNMKAYDFDINDNQTPYTVKSLVSIGYHLSYPDWYGRLKSLNGIGFKFKVPPAVLSSPDYTGIETADYWKGQSSDLSQNGDTIDVDMSSRVESLNNMGFNFNMDGYADMLKFLSDVGINLASAWAENALSELNNFGINFNDANWRTKCDKFKLFGINFSSVEWIDEMFNLKQLGIDFNDTDWETAYDKSTRLGVYGLDYRSKETRKKLAALTEMCIDFTQPEDQYKDKIESLIDIGLVTLSHDNSENRRNIKDDYDKQCKSLDDAINKKQDEIDGKPDVAYKTKLQDNDSEMKNLMTEISNLKDKSVLALDYELPPILSELESKCTRLAELENENKELTGAMKPSDKSKDVLDSELDKLKKERASLARPKPYNLKGYSIIIAEIEKLKALADANFSFCDDNYADNIKKLKDGGMDFSKDNWAFLLDLLKGLIPVNPITAWIKTIIKVITTVITMPVQLIFGLIKKLIDLVMSLISVPMNPAKIPEFAKNIIKKFKSFISMVTKLPTVDGMMDILFLSAEGLMLVDVFLPGFANYMSAMKKKSGNSAPTDDELNRKKRELSDLRVEKNTSMSGNLSEIDKKNAMLDGTFDKAGLQSGINAIASNIDALKRSVKDGQPEDTKKAILSEIENMCTTLSDMDNTMKELQSLADSTINSQAEKDKLKDDIAALMADIDKSTKDYDDKIKKLEAEIKALEFKAALSKKFNFCNISENQDEFLKLLNDLKNDIATEEDPDKAKYDDNNNKIKDLEDRLNALIKPAPSNKSNDTKNDIKGLEDYVCNNRANMSDSEFDDVVAKINALYDDLSTSTEQSGATAGDLVELNKQIEDLKKDNDTLKKNIDANKKKKQQMLNELDAINKWMLTVVNILCSIPALIVNIVVGLLNSVGYMRNLPTLWEFPYV